MTLGGPGLRNGSLEHYVTQNSGPGHAGVTPTRVILIHTRIICLLYWKIKNEIEPQNLRATAHGGYMYSDIASLLSS